MPKYIKKKDLKRAIECCTWYHINKNGELVEGANSAEDEPLYKHSDIKKIIKDLPTRKFKDEPQLSRENTRESRESHEIAKDEPKSGYCNECKWFGDKQVCGICRSKHLYVPKDEPQTENLFTDKDGDVWEWRGDAWYCISGDESQTDCPWK